MRERVDRDGERDGDGDSDGMHSDGPGAMW